MKKLFSLIALLFSSSLLLSMSHPLPESEKPSPVISDATLPDYMERLQISDERTMITENCSQSQYDDDHDFYEEILRKICQAVYERNFKKADTLVRQYIRRYKYLLEPHSDKNNGNYPIHRACRYTKRLNRAFDAPDWIHNLKQRIKEKIRLIDYFIVCMQDYGWNKNVIFELQNDNKQTCACLLSITFNKLMKKTYDKLLPLRNRTLSEEEKFAIQRLVVTILRLRTKFIQDMKLRHVSHAPDQSGNNYEAEGLAFYKNEFTNLLVELGFRSNNKNPRSPHRSQRRRIPQASSYQRVNTPHSPKTIIVPKRITSSTSSSSNRLPNIHNKRPVAQKHYFL